MLPAIDAKALKILLNYRRISDSGRSYAPSSEDFAYAVAAHYMFPSSSVEHDPTVQLVLKLISDIDSMSVASAFLASLSTRRVDLRSALGSYAVGRFFPEHTFQPSEYYAWECYVCRSYSMNAEPNLLSFQKHKWGGVAQLDPYYIAFDLGQFVLLPRVSYTSRDIDIFKAIIDRAGSMSPNDSPQALVRALSGVLDASSYERQVLIEILGYCGILQDPEHPGFANRFVPQSERAGPSARPSNWRYPVVWWRGRHGVNEEALALFFPDIYPSGN